MQANPACAYIVTEAQFPDRGTKMCHGMDPEDPTCAKASIRGTIHRVQGGSADEALAKQALFTAHPDMAEWPAGHNFAL